MSGGWVPDLCSPAPPAGGVCGGRGRARRPAALLPGGRAAAAAARGARGRARARHARPGPDTEPAVAGAGHTAAAGAQAKLSRACPSSQAWLLQVPHCCGPCNTGHAATTGAKAQAAHCANNLGCCGGALAGLCAGELHGRRGRTANMFYYALCVCWRGRRGTLVQCGSVSAPAHPACAHNPTAAAAAENLGPPPDHVRAGLPATVLYPYLPVCQKPCKVLEM